MEDETLEKLIRNAARCVKRLEKTVLLLDKKVISKGGLISQVSRMSMKVDALTRRMLLRDVPAQDPGMRLMSQRASLYSQNGEDGIVLALIREIGNPTQKFVELGCGENGGNSGVLAFELGWSGLMVDANPVRIENLRNNFQFDPQKVAVRHCWVTSDNGNDIIRENGMSGEVDLLSIDLDGVDYWIWKTIGDCSPRIVVIEYNSSFGPERSVTIPYHPEFKRTTDFRIYHGASLAALCKLGKEKKYRLIGVEPRGVNAVFLRNDILTEIYPSVKPSNCFKMLDKHILYKTHRGYRDIYEELKRRELPVVEV